MAALRSLRERARGARGERGDKRAELLAALGLGSVGDDNSPDRAAPDAEVRNEGGEDPGYSYQTDPYLVEENRNPR